MSGRDRAKSERLAFNERVTSISRAFMNLGTGLFAAASARIYVGGDLDRTSLFWISCVIALMFAGLKVLDLLEVEADQ